MRPEDSWSPVVAVPARDEEERLPRLLAALAAQSWFGTADRTLAVVIVLNNCTDRSRAAVLSAAKAAPRLAIDLVTVDFPPEVAHVGSARSLAFDRAFASLPVPSRGILITTDADAIPAPDWIEANIRAIDAGADLVGGSISGNPDEEARLGPGFLRRAAAIASYATLADRLASLLDPLPHDPWPRHRDHTGASLAVRADMFWAVGGMQALPFREDLGFVGRVRAAGGRLRHAPDVRVEVSARIVGRAPGGMADCLKDWMRAEAEGAPILVEAPEALEARFLKRHLLRGLPESTSVRLEAARRFGLDPLAFVDADGRPFAGCELVEMLAPDDPDAPATVPVATATARLLAMIDLREASAFAA